ncbi:DnaB-like helicase N-terminal domain-containing protein [Streptacidiphilus jiangxiensis]|uniref:DnaB-like helicase N terminal domain-containing protein n=1 Tax=Streptacidiphilus jiangxiensis TaxID=235985 RepID=A0A1H8A483_STRJI|nr:DnaB-like helicase N-terminal domain-containing protein [Streptacidiphilus jiangxiensis]SEM65702.1 DnaB-like helicase N terminal domain-containing protein [Streptacidiphilus jiangxiensis]
MTGSQNTLGTTPPAVEGPDPVVLAEQALLGALLLDPQQTRTVHEWLAAQNFYRAAHRALYQALVDQFRAGHPALAPHPGKEEALAWLTDAVATASRTTRGISPSYPHTLAAACPRSDHAPVYGRMVVEAALQRTVAEHATRMLTSAQTTLAAGGEARILLTHLDILTEVLDQLGRLAGVPRPGHGADQSAPGLGEPAVVNGSVEQLGQDLLAEEEMLLGTLLQTPQVIGEMAVWLRPADFADPGLGAVFSLLVALHRNGRAIDQVTLLWEARRRGLLTDQVLTVERILGLVPAPGDPAFGGEIVARRALARTASAAAWQVRDFAATMPPSRLVPRALALLAPVQQARQRWQAATAPAAERVQSFRARR